MVSWSLFIAVFLTMLSLNLISIPHANGSDISDGGSNCDSITEDIRPIELANVQYKNRVEKAFFIQKVKQTRCRQDNEPCFGDFYRSSAAKCKTVYRDITIVIDGEGIRSSPIGVGCVCQIQPRADDLIV